jgi:hypothetical protein
MNNAMNKMLTSLVLAMTVLTLASSAMADESNGAKAYKALVKGPIDSWASQMSNRVAVYAS